MLDQFKGALGGYMTYITAVSGILGAIIAWQQGAITTEKMIELVWGAIAVIFVRRGIKSAQGEQPK